MTELIMINWNAVIKAVNTWDDDDIRKSINEKAFWNWMLDKWGVDLEHQTVSDPNKYTLFLLKYA